MQPTKLEDRPPFITFETRSVEDRAATILQGHYVGRDVDCVFITPAGSKDRIERVVVEWLAQLQEDLKAERIPPEWVQHFRRAYEDYKAGRETPLNGTSILNWPGLSPSQTKTLLSLHLRTIEDIAAANEETVGRLGMGGRALKQRAVDWLSSAANVGKAAESLSAIRIENEQLQERNKMLAEQNALLSAQLSMFQQIAAPRGAVADTADFNDISAADLDLGDKL